MAPACAGGSGAAIIGAVRILFVSSEVAPFAKVGGLADVASSLTLALARAGHEVRIVMPAYDMVTANGYRPGKDDPEMLGLDLGTHRVVADLLRLDLGDVPVTLIDVPPLYHRGDLYSDAADEHLRFAVLSRGALELCSRWGWSPDIIHCNDWQTALIPLELRTHYAGIGTFAGTKTVLTIHNLEYQGVFDRSVLPRLDFGPFLEMFHQDHLEEGWVSFLETGLLHADALTTVSPTYAREILTPELGAGMDPILRARSDHLHGILNGIDAEVWNPTTDSHISHRYSTKSLWRKEWNKRDLIQSLGLDYVEGVPVFGIVSRLVPQKGIGLIPRPMSGILESTDSRFVALGAGDDDLEAGLRWLVDRFPGQACFVSGYDEPLSHRIEAGVDVFMMPSLYEPSGLNQMYSLAYGTPPLVRETGGLADTVRHWDPEARTGNGFVFEHYDEGGVWWALNESLNAMKDRAGWKQLQLNGMAEDHSWEHPASEYEDLYRRLVGSDA